MGQSLHVLLVVASFAFIVLASQRIGQVFTRFHLPLISGCLFAGIVAGPFVLGLIEKDAAESLRLVDEISLAVIAFAAGSELYLKELRGRLRSIAWVTLGNTLFIPIIGGSALFLLADAIPFLRDLPTAARLGVSLLAGAILVARSPSSAIAIVDELRAKGPFTQTVLGVTMITDVVVIALFAISSSLADALLLQLPFDATFVLLLLFEFAMEVVLGYLLALLLRALLGSHISTVLKAAGVLLAGAGVFILTGWIRETSSQLLPVEIFLEPLLTCMVASFFVTNYSPYRADFLKLLHDIGPPVYIAFFTLTGATLALDVLAQTWPIALALFGARLVGIFVGSFTGGLLAGDSMLHNRISWLTYITQAGVGLGLAKEAAVEFPEWGDAFATTMISVIVLSQLVGPPFFKWAVTRAGEAHPRGSGTATDATRNALIFGLETQGVTLARLLHNHGWNVTIASRSAGDREPADMVDVDIRPISRLDLATLEQLGAPEADAIIALLSNDENYQICSLAYEHFGTENLVVRLTDQEDYQRFQKLGVRIVEPTTAIAHLLDHFVRSPAAASIFLGMEENQAVVDVQLRNANLHGLALRELRLPLDVLILSVRRRDSLLVSHGYTRLEVGDWVTVVGSPASLDKVLRRFAA